MFFARVVAIRVAAGLLALALVAVATFGLLAAQPGTAADRFDDPRIPASAREAWRAQLALDQPWHVRMGRQAMAAARGDLGWSVARAQPVADALRHAVGPSALLGLTGLGLGLVVGLVLGTWQGAAPERPSSRWTARLMLLIVATPDFWLALVIMTLGAKVAGLFPVGGWPRDDTLLAQVHHLVLPAGTLALLVAARVSRFHRAATASARREGWVHAARARGLSASRVRWRHLSRTAAAPTVALAGLLVPMVVAGTVFVEVVFSWPGIGRLLLDAVQARDVPLAIGATLVTAVAAVVGSAAADIVHAGIDPRVRTA